MESKGLTCEPAQVANLMGDAAKIEFTNHFKEIQRLKTQLDQYTDLDETSKDVVEQKLPTDTLRGFKAMYLDTALELKRKQGKSDDPTDPVNQVELELVIFASAIIDYDYIMKLIAQSTQTTSKQKMTRQQVIEIIKSHSNFEVERDDIVDYINSLKTGEVLTEQQIRDGYQTFKQQKSTQELQQVAKKHGLDAKVLQVFVDGILDRMIFDGEGLTDLLAPLELGWKERRKVELALMDDLVPYLLKQVSGREISGLNAYE
jgi:type I restriction enzyme R subunit